MILHSRGQARDSVIQSYWLLLRGLPPVIAAFLFGGIMDYQAMFWAKVQRTDSCWIWTACKNDKGYGNLRIRGKGCLAHRVAYQFTFGDIPKGMNVLHKCDNPACVNPNHLWLGTLADNNRDMIAKGRARLGIGKGNHFSKPRRGNKLTVENVREIRNRVANGERQQDIADLFGITNSLVSTIASRKRWAIVD